MSKSRKSKRKNNAPTVTAAAGRRFPRQIVVLMAIVIVAAGVFGWIKWRHADIALAAAPPPMISATNEPAPAAMPNLAFEKLKGKWQRPDGGYIVEIRSVEPGGKMDAAYFNPRPINVAKAQASQEGAVTKVFVELRDVNYPGSTYTLAYQAQSDQLSGIYYQAALQQKYEVVFERIK